MFHVEHCKKGETVKHTAGIDFITMTMAHDDSDYSDWVDRAHWWVLKQQDYGHTITAAGAHGYSGMRCGGRFVGYREDGAMVRASGSEAGPTFWHNYSTWCGVSRIDLQVTVWIAQLSVAKHIRAMYAKLREDSHGRKSKVLSCSMTQNSSGGATLYAGSRKSEVMLRVYDKGAESGEEDYKGAIRYELELKGKRAARSARRIFEAGEDALPAYCLGTVEKFCHDNLIYFPSLEGARDQLDLTVRANETDVERRLKWLKKQVAPTVAWLIEQGEAPAVYRALGIGKF